jgi:pectinesterase
LQLTNLTIVNSLLDKADADAHPAVALNVDADRVLLDNVHLIGRQNTLMINTNDINNQPVSNHYNRLYVNNSVIEGDVDYVTGYGNAVFNQVDFHTVSSRGVKQASVFAANTPAYVPYGFLVTHSTFTGDKGFASKQAIKAQLGRAWDLGAEGGYVAGQTSNSVVVIRDSQIDSSYNLLHPWGVAAFSQRPFNGNITPNRNVNDPNFNRLWQYNNILATE